MPEFYGGTWPHIAKYFGEGIARGMTEEIAESRGLERAIKAFGRLRPLREMQRAEELEGYRGKLGVGEEFTVRGESRKAAKERTDLEALRQGLGPFLAEAFATQPAPDRAEFETETPYTIPEGMPPKGYDLLFNLLGQQSRAAQREPRAPTEVELALQATDMPTRSGSPLAKEALKTLAKHRGIVAGKQTGGRIGAELDMPPRPTEETRKELAGLESALSQGQRVVDRFKTEYAGIVGGGIRGKTMARIFGPSEEEGKFRASAAVFRRNLRQQFSGLAVTAPELWMNIEAIPDPEKVAPEMFMAVVEENLTDLREKLRIRSGQYQRPAGQPTTPSTGRRRDLGGGFYLED